MEQSDRKLSSRLSLSPRQAFWAGALFWVGVSVLGIYLRGIRWEETYERAQALTGIVPYPVGHPLAQYARGAIGFHYYLSAAIMQFTQDPRIICGYRDIWSAAFALIPLYALGYVLTRKLWLAHLSALLGMAGIHLFFCSYYGLQIWPDKFTAGTIGQGYALFILVAFMGRHWRAGFALLGFMPIIHLGHMPVVLGVGVLAALWLVYIRHQDRLDIAVSFFMALGCSLGLIALLRYFSLPEPTEGAFYTSADYLDAWRRYEYYEDIHRAPTATPRFGAFANSIMVVVGLLLASVACWRLDWNRESKPSPFLWVLWYAIGTGMAIAAAKLGQWYWAEHVPYLLIGWLPYRSPNLCAFLLIPTLIYGATRVLPDPRAGLSILVLTGLFGVRPLLAIVLPGGLYESYIAPPEHFLFFLFGLTMASLAIALKAAPRFRIGWLLALLLAWCLLFGAHQFGAALLLAGSVTGLGIHCGNRMWRDVWTGTAVMAATVGVVALFGGLLLELHRSYLPALENTPFENEVAALIGAEAQPGELVLTPHWHLNWQEKLNQPVFVTFETPLFLPYLRRLAGPIEKMMDEAYDIRFGEPWDYRLEAWKGQNRAEWKALGATYGIRFVLSPNTVPLDLTPVLRGETLTLWRVE